MIHIEIIIGWYFFIVFGWVIINANDYSSGFLIRLYKYLMRVF